MGGASWRLGGNLALTATIDSLANETLDQIMELLYDEIYYTYEHHLFSAALVCRRWRDPARRALFTQAQTRRRHAWLGDKKCALQWIDSPARTRFQCRSLILDRVDAADVGDVVSLCGKTGGGRSTPEFPHSHWFVFQCL